MKFYFDISSGECHTMVRRSPPSHRAKHGKAKRMNNRVALANTTFSSTRLVRVNNRVVEGFSPKPPVRKHTLPVRLQRRETHHISPFVSLLGAQKKSERTISDFFISYLIIYYSRLPRSLRGPRSLRRGPRSLPRSRRGPRSARGARSGST